MKKVAERIGMPVEACIRNARTVEEQYVDTIEMEMLREEWEKLNAN